MPRALRASLFSCMGIAALACSSPRSTPPEREAAGAGTGTGGTAGEPAQEAGAPGSGAGAPAGSAGTAGSLATGTSGSAGVASSAGTGGQAGAGGAAGAPPHWVSSKCKRGIAVNDVSLADLAALSPSVTWFYNWGDHLPTAVTSQAAAAAGLDFAPMIYGGDPNVDTEVGAIPNGAHYLLGFNEPNFHAEGNLSASAAAALWPKLEAIAKARDLELVGPAVNYCGPESSCWDTDPFSYLNAFFTACPSCRVDYIGVHWYACDAGGLEWYLTQAEKYGKPIWLTEFNCPGGDAAAQLAYMKIALPILEADPQVFRYSWLMARSSQPTINLLAGNGELTDLGKAYVAAPVSPDCFAEQHGAGGAGGASE